MSLQTSLTLEQEDSVATLNIEFVPITLTKVRCLVLVCNSEELGQMMFEIVGEPQMFTPSSCSVHFKQEAKQESQSWLSLEAKNSALLQAIGYSRARREQWISMFRKQSSRTW